METQSQSILNVVVALHKFQSLSQPVFKNQTGFGNKYKFANLNTIVTQIQPLLSECGLAFTQLITGNAEKVIVQTVLFEIKSGEYISTQIEADVEKNNIKTGLSNLQAVGSIITYLKRYSLTSMLGITSSDVDTDGVIHTPNNTSKTTSNPQQSTQNQNQTNSIKPSTSVVNQLKNNIIAIKESGKIEPPKIYDEEINILLDVIEKIDDINQLHILYDNNKDFAKKHEVVWNAFKNRGAYLK